MANLTIKYPSLSVIIPAYNSERTIERCLKSVITAIPRSKEIIVIDDGSIDNTSKVASQFPIRLLRKTFGTSEGEE